MAKNGIIREFNKYGLLIFEGEYLSGKKNGKIKEYDKDTGKLLIEGEYLNDEKNGIIKEFNGYGKLIFEGLYIKGQKNGKGKEYRNNELIFEGEYLNNERWNGKGKEYKNNELIFEGEYLNGERIGKIYNKNGTILSGGKYGDYIDGKWNSKIEKYFKKD